MVLYKCKQNVRMAVCSSHQIWAFALSVCALMCEQCPYTGSEDAILLLPLPKSLEVSNCVCVFGGGSGSGVQCEG